MFIGINLYMIFFIFVTTMIMEVLLKCRGYGRMFLPDFFLTKFTYFPKEHVSKVEGYGPPPSLAK